MKNVYVIFSISGVLFLSGCPSGGGGSSSSSTTSTPATVSDPATPAISAPSIVTTTPTVPNSGTSDQANDPTIPAATPTASPTPSPTPTVAFSASHGNYNCYLYTDHSVSCSDGTNTMSIPSSWGTQRVYVGSDIACVMAGTQNEPLFWTTPTGCKASEASCDTSYGSGWQSSAYCWEQTNSTADQGAMQVDVIGNLNFSSPWTKSGSVLTIASESDGSICMDVQVYQVSPDEYIEDEQLCGTSLSVHDNYNNQSRSYLQ